MLKFERLLETYPRLSAKGHTILSDGDAALGHDGRECI